MKEITIKIELSEDFENLDACLRELAEDAMMEEIIKFTSNLQVKMNRYVFNLRHLRDETKREK